MQNYSVVPSICTGFMLVCACATGHAADRTWNGPVAGDWGTADNWTPSGAPQAGESVLVDNGSLLLSSETAALDSFTITGATLTFSNWTTTLAAQTVTIGSGGNLMAASAFDDVEMSNRVAIVCSNFVLASGGSIDLDGLGYKADGTNVYGPGAGPSYVNRGSGGSYGGIGGGARGNAPAAEYGLTNAPTQPGSAGGYGYTPQPSGGNGGGALRIVATNATINGTITANGGNSGTYGGGGSGGAIYITCATLAGTGGIVRANGGDCGTADSGSGGGGRIAVDCTHMIGVVDVRFAANSGDESYRGRMGSLYFPDTAILSTDLSQLDGVRLFIPGLAAWSVDRLTVTNGGGSFGDGPFALTVTNDLTLAAGAWLNLGGQATSDGLAVAGVEDGGSNLVLAVGGDLVIDGGVLTLGGQDQKSMTTAEIGGGLVLTNAAELYVYSGVTNAGQINGAVLSVAVATVLGGSSWVYPYCHRTNGGIALFALGDLQVAAGSGFDADDEGFPWFGTTCYAPARGATTSVRGAGSGYGGAGGDRLPATGGQTYGLTNAPMLPGAPGGYGHSSGYAKPGGGAVRIDAASVTLDGTITACQTLDNVYGGGGSGGGIFVTCDTFAGAASGLLRADGGDAGSYVVTGGGGGGRIAVGVGLTEAQVQKLVRGQSVDGLVAYQTHAQFAGTLSVANGAGNGTGGEPGEAGTARFLAADTYTLTVVGDPGDYDSPSPNGYGTHAELPQNSWVTNAVNTPTDEAAGTRHALLRWELRTDSVFDQGTATQAVCQLTNNLTLTWYWTNEYQLALSSAASTNGSVNTALNGWYTNATVVTGIFASASNGYMFSQWTGDAPLGHETENPLSVSMTQPRTIVAQFASASGVTKTWTGIGPWTSASNWSPSGAPGSLDEVHVASGEVMIAQPTWVRSVVVSNGASLVFTNWSPTLNAETVTIRSGGKVTVANAFDDVEMSNRVFIVCSNFMLESGGVIDVDELGYKADGVNVYGPGAGPSYSGNRGSGGSYGGIGGGAYGYAPAPEYGWTNAPTQPGSAGGYGYEPAPAGGNGGGAVRIIATNAIINGTITANGTDVVGNYGGGGSGGGIYITCTTLAGTGGVVRANGGDCLTANTGSGGGGRIAVDCTNMIGVVDIRFSADGGDNNYLGRMGSLYFPDTAILSANLTQLDRIRLFVPGLTAWSVAGLTVTNGGGSFGDGPFALTVTNDLTVAAGAWLSLGGQATRDGLAVPGVVDSGTNPVLNVGGDLTLDGGVLTLGGQDQASIGSVAVGGCLVLSNAAGLYVYSGATNATHTNGAILSVAGTTLLNGSSWIYPYCHQTNGGAALFALGDLSVAQGSGFDANDKGFSWVGTKCYAPDHGASYESRGAGSGYGGAGGARPSAAAGATYGLTKAPILPGAPGGYGHGTGYAKAGGGAVLINAAAVTLDGTMTACQTLDNRYGGGGSGGSVLIICRSFSGAASGLVCANGGDAGSYPVTGGGGGGRIAVAIGLSGEDIGNLLRNGPVDRLALGQAHSRFGGALTAASGLGNGSGGEVGEVGTAWFLTIEAPSGTLLMIR